MSGVHDGHLKGSTRHRSSFLKLQKANSRKTLWKVSPQILPVWKKGCYYFNVRFWNLELKILQMKREFLPVLCKGIDVQAFWEMPAEITLAWPNSSVQMKWTHQIWTAFGGCWPVFVSQQVTNPWGPFARAKGTAHSRQAQVVWTWKQKYIYYLTSICTTQDKKIIVRPHIAFWWDIKSRRKWQHTVDSHQDSLLSWDDGEVLVWTTGADLYRWRNRKQTLCSIENFRHDYQ